MKKWELLSMVVVLLTFVVIPGCLDENGDKGGLKFIDPLGQEVVLEDMPERIATLSPAITETVFALGVGDKVVATDNVSNYPPEVAGLPKVFSFTGLFTEQLIIADPDLVIMDKTLDISEEAYDTIKGLGIPVYRIYPMDVDDVLEAIMGIGNITGTGQAARNIVDDMRSRMDVMNEYVEDIAPGDRPGVLLVTYYDGNSDPWVSTDSTMAGGIIDFTGGVNVIHDGAGIVVQVPVETVVGADPDIIICTQSTVWRTETKDKVLNDTRWKDISAVKEGRVYEVDGDLIDRTGPRLIEGMEAIHSMIVQFIEGQ